MHTYMPYEYIYCFKCTDILKTLQDGLYYKVWVLSDKKLSLFAWSGPICKHTTVFIKRSK